MALLTRLSLSALILASTAAAWGATGQDPYIGYAYPAGGQQGSVVRITIAGQRLRGANAVYVSGEGVRASVVGYEGAGGLLNRLQQEELKRRLKEIKTKRAAGRTGAKSEPKPKKKADTGEMPPDAAKTPKVTLPDIPELRNLEQMTGKELKQVYDRFLNRSKRPKAPMAERVTLEVTIDPGAKTGDRELRLRASTGLTNPVVFQVGQLPEDQEPGEYETRKIAPISVQSPVVLNGRIMPGEVDRFPVKLQRGQKLVAIAQARHLIPYLADAVPGWFQAVLTLRDANGRELAFADNCGFDPDPVLFYQAAQDGDYVLEIRDSIYRGRWDFVYRIVVGEDTLVGSILPSGSRGGVSVVAVDREQSKSTQSDFRLSNETLPRRDEVEPNDAGKTAQSITPPHVVSGKIARSGDRDIFRIKGRTGDQVVAEVYARRLGSPLDSLLKLMDASGKVIAMNDDNEDKSMGLLTHHADSYLSAKLPATGDYLVQVSDTQNHGGSEYNYHLRIGPPIPNFALRMTPSSVNLITGCPAPITVYAMRKDGWDGDIDISLKDAPDGFILSGARIPKGRDHVRMTLTAPQQRSVQPFVLQLEGRAQVNGKVVTRQVIPAENMMQAFAYYHLTPSQQLMAVTRFRRNSPSFERVDGSLLRITAGGRAEVAYKMSPPMPNALIRLELSDPPEGVSIQETKTTPGGVTLVLKADDKHIGYQDNLIVEASVDMDVKSQDGASMKKQRVSLGTLPAIPFEIVKQ